MSDIERLHDELEAMFTELWQRPRFSGSRPGFRPPVDVVRTEKPAELRVVVDLAGVDPASIQIVVDAHALLITGQRRPQHQPGGVSYHQLEIQYGSFERRFSLPEPIEPGSARASYERGLLTIRLPIARAPQPQERVSIAIRTKR